MPSSFFREKEALNGIKKSARGVIWQYRLSTWKYRALPDFIIIGAQKAGTTSLYHYLGQHPQLLPAIGKEAHFFDGGLFPNIDDYEKGEKWFRAHFPLKKYARASFYKAYEESPLYIFNPLAPERMHKLIPSVKIVGLLRNPTERAISHYFHEKRKRRETLPITEALQKEKERLGLVVARKDYKNSIFIHCSYKSRGRYKEQLERYRQHFPKEQILAIASEELFARPEKNLKKVFEFIGVDPNFRIKDLSLTMFQTTRAESKQMFTNI